MEALLMLLVSAGVIEALWEHLKPLWPRRLKILEEEKGKPVDQLGVLVIALAGCLTTKFDLLETAELCSVPYLGSALSGIFVSRLANLWHDLLGTIGGIRNDQKPLKIESGL
jgi:hypothetical protein